MSLRTLSALAFVSTSLLLGVGCAADPGDLEAGDHETEADANEAEGAELPKVQTDAVDTQASGQSCVCPAGKVYQAGLCYTPCAAGWPKTLSCAM